MTTNRRISRRLAAAIATTLGLVGLSAGLAHAEFEVQESTIDPGEIQLQYRGAWHDGIAVSDDDGDEVPLSESQEFELQMSVTSRWLIAFTQGYTQPTGDDFDINAIELESQIEIVTLHDEGFGFAMQGGVEKSVGNAGGEPGDIHFGPIFEYGKGKFLLTNDILFFDEQGSDEQQGLGLEYSFQAAYNVTDKLMFALEAFGEVDDLSNSGPFDTQEHYIGPTIYYTWGDDDEDSYVDDATDSGAQGKYSEFTLSFGMQFGLTKASSDMAAKVFVGYEFN